MHVMKLSRLSPHILYSMQPKAEEVPGNKTMFWWKIAVCVVLLVVVCEGVVQSPFYSTTSFY